MAPIRTKTHILANGVSVAHANLEQARDKFLSGQTYKAGTDLDQIFSDIQREDFGKSAATHDCVRRILDASNYVVDRPVLDLLLREDVSKSLTALLECGMARLPVSPMTIEYEASPDHHEFVCLEEITSTKVAAYMATLDNRTNQALAVMRPITVEISSRASPEETRNLVDLFPNQSPKNGAGFIFDGVPPHDKGARVIVGTITVALQLAYLMLNTMGIEREVVEAPVALNKSRIAKGKPPIKRHCIVHIGRIYKRDGTHVDATGATGRSMPMHIRQAHVRHVPYGPMAIDPTGKRRGDGRATRMHFIPMCIVNFSADEPAPRVQKEIRL